uniref:Uncharacterized protein n=1 Tax=Thermosphaera aggregans TaxID=54254 RepID=A0A7C2FDB9_9CREN
MFERQRFRKDVEKMLGISFAGTVLHWYEDIYITCYTRKAPPEAYGWLMEIVPSRSYKLNMRPYSISIDEIKKMMEYLRENMNSTT